MELLPQGRNANRFTAIGLLLAAVAVVYLVFFHFTFVQPWVQAGDRLEKLEKQLANFLAVSAQRDELKKQLAKVRRFQTNNDYFLQEDTVSLAGAALASRLKQIVEHNKSSAESCRVITTRTQDARDPERFKRVIVQVRMHCDIDDLQKVLYELESGSPLVFLDNVSVYQNQVRARGGGFRDLFLDVRFDMYGYIRKPGGAATRSS